MLPLSCEDPLNVEIAVHIDSLQKICLWKKLSMFVDVCLNSSTLEEWKEAENQEILLPPSSMRRYWESVMSSQDWKAIH